MSLFQSMLSAKGIAHGIVCELQLLCACAISMQASMPFMLFPCYQPMISGVAPGLNI